MFPRWEILKKFRLTLGELEAFAGTGATWLLSFTHPRITGQKTVNLESGAIFGIEIQKSAGNGETKSPCLSLKSTTRGLGLDVVVLDGMKSLKWFEYGILLRDRGKIIVKVAAINSDLAGAGSEVDTGDCRLAATSRGG